MLRPANWAPTTADRQRLLSFEGYGVDNPDIIFVGLEEYCTPDYDGQRDGIWIRCTSQIFAAKRIDKNQARSALAGVGRQGVPVWDVIAAILSALTGRPCHEEWDALGTRPASEKLSTWLTELRPLPRPGVKAFKTTYIPEWFKQDYPTKADFRRKSVDISGPRIQAALSGSPAPQYAFFYGRPACEWAKECLSPFLTNPFAESGENIETGRTVGGTLIALTGFYNGQHVATAFRCEHIKALMDCLS